MIDTHDCILNGNIITIEPAIKSECDCSNIKLTLSTVCQHACNDDKVHIKVDFDDVTNKPYALTYVDNMYNMLEKNLGMDDLSGFVTNDKLSVIGYALQSDVENRINDVTNFISETYARKDEIPDTSNLATKDDIDNLSNDIVNNYALKDEIPSLEGYAKTEDIPDTSNLATKDEIVTEFKTINGETITGTGNIEISGGSSETIDTSNFARTDTANTFNGNNIFNYSDYDSGCATFNGRTTFKDEINIEIDAIPKEDISRFVQCDMKQTKGQVATLYTGRILAPVTDTESHTTNVINFGLNNNMKFIDGVGLYIQGEKLTDTYARKDEIPSLDGYAKTEDIPVITKQSDYSINSWDDGHSFNLYSDNAFEKFVANITLSTILSINYNNDMFWQHKDKTVIPLSYNNEAAYYITQRGGDITQRYEFDFRNDPVNWWGDNLAQSTSWKNVCENGFGITMLQGKPTALTKKLSNLDAIHTLVFPDYIESIGTPYVDDGHWETTRFNHTFYKKVIVLPMNIKSIYASSGLFDQQCTIIFKSLTAPEIVFDGHTSEDMFRNNDGSNGTIYYPRYYENNYETLRNILGDKWDFIGIVFDYQEYDS